MACEIPDAVLFLFFFKPIAFADQKRLLFLS
jgi:hypothetical protein